MFVDLNDMSGEVSINTDICIIGSGAAGISLALEFINSNYDVVVVESGGLIMEATSQGLYQSDVVGLPHESIHLGRARTYGGTTTLWAGQALPLSPIDFEVRNWVEYSGWPINYDHLLPYYRRAEHVMQIPEISYDGSSWPKNISAPRFRDKLYPVMSQFSKHPDFGKLYAKEIENSRNVKLIYHATVLKIDTDESKKAVESLQLGSIDGKMGRLKAKRYVICCGGIESARLLLLSEIGNQYDLVGRFFQEHIHYTACPIVPNPNFDIRKSLSIMRVEGMKRSPKYAISTEIQRSQKLLNCAGEIVYPQTEDSPIEALRTVVRVLKKVEDHKKLSGSINKILRRPDYLAKAAYRRYVRHLTVDDWSGDPYIGISCEQNPNPDSRVTLGEHKDAFGLRRTVLDWRLSELDIFTMRQFVQVVAEEFEDSGVGKVDIEKMQLPDSPSLLAGVVHDAAHHMGTCRMSESPSMGVVDSHCRVHDMTNLFIGSSAVFPTGGFSNPTLTIIALCIRIADQLKTELKY